MECRANRVLLNASFNCLFSPLADHSNGSFNFKALSGGSGYKFGVLAKIVNYMKVQCFVFKYIMFLNTFHYLFSCGS